MKRRASQPNSPIRVHALSNPILACLAQAAKYNRRNNISRS